MGIPARSSSLAAAGPASEIPYRVVVIEDSAVIRGMMSRWLGEDDEFDVVARYGSGISALKRTGDVEAEVVVLDIESKNMNGMELLSQLLEKDPTLKILAVATSEKSAAMARSKAADVIVRSAVTREVTTSTIFREDFLKRSRGLGRAYRRDNNESRSKARRAPKVNAKVNATVTPAQSSASGKDAYTLIKPSRVKPRILAVGSSTGGPKALYEVFSRLQGELTVPVVITQHMPPMFTSILAEHLTKASGAVAKEGEDGERVVSGNIYVAPGDMHMVLTGNEVDLRIELNQGPEENFCRPSVDPLFRSVAKIFGPSALCIILTGMGQDGCEGSKDIVKAGGTVVAQDEETSVVWGMPGAVAKAGLCADVLPLAKIGPRAISLLKGVVR